MRLGAHPLVVAVALGLLGPEALAAPAARPVKRATRTEHAANVREATVAEAEAPAWDALIALADDLRHLSPSR
jgi:hypothetical protein